MLTNIWIGCCCLKRLVFQLQAGLGNEHKCGGRNGVNGIDLGSVEECGIVGMEPT